MNNENLKLYVYILKAKNDMKIKTNDENRDIYINKYGMSHIQVTLNESLKLLKWNIYKYNSDIDYNTLTVNNKVNNKTIKSLESFIKSIFSNLNDLVEEGTLNKNIVDSFKIDMIKNFKYITSMSNEVFISKYKYTKDDKNKSKKISVNNISGENFLKYEIALLKIETFTKDEDEYKDMIKNVENLKNEIENLKNENENLKLKLDKKESMVDDNVKTINNLLGITNLSKINNLTLKDIIETFKTSIYVDANIKNDKTQFYKITVCDYNSKRILNNYIPNEFLNDNGDYSLNYNNLNCNVCEMIAIYFGLCVANKKGIKNIFSDSQVAINLCLNKNIKYYKNALNEEYKKDIFLKKIETNFINELNKFLDNDGNIMWISSKINPADK